MEEMYKVVFYDDDKETILDEQEVNYGDKVEFLGNIPQKNDEHGIQYEFDGWELDGDLNYVTSDIIAYAKYIDSTRKKIK